MDQQKISQSVVSMLIERLSDTLLTIAQLGVHIDGYDMRNWYFAAKSVDVNRAIGVESELKSMGHVITHKSGSNYEALAMVCEILIRVRALPNPFTLCEGVHIFAELGESQL